MITAKATTDLNTNPASPKYQANRFSITPRIPPPRAAPGRLVIPPRTAEAKPLRRGSIIRLGSRVVMGARSNPETAPIRELSPQVKENILLVLIPIRRAAI